MDFEQKKDFLLFPSCWECQFKCSKNFLRLQKSCLEYRGASTTSGLSNAHRIVVIECVEQKVRNESWKYVKIWVKVSFSPVLTQTSLCISLFLSIFYWIFSHLFVTWMLRSRQDRSRVQAGQPEVGGNSTTCWRIAARDPVCKGAEVHGAERLVCCCWNARDQQSRWPILHILHGQSKEWHPEAAYCLDKGYLKIEHV